jgi:hypothetical protein
VSVPLAPPRVRLHSAREPLVVAAVHVALFVEPFSRRGAPFTVPRARHPRDSDRDSLLLVVHSLEEVPDFADRMADSLDAVPDSLEQVSQTPDEVSHRLERMADLLEAVPDLLVRLENTLEAMPGFAERMADSLEAVPDTLDAVPDTQTAFSLSRAHPPRPLPVAPLLGPGSS